MNETKLSIIIPNWLTERGGKIANEAEAYWFLRHCIERIKKFTKNSFELILIDNGSTVGIEYIKSQADKYVRNEKNLGFAIACNQGFALAKGEFVVCVNNDILVWQDWDVALLKTFEDNLDCGVAMPALVSSTKDARVALEMDELDLSTNFGKYGRGAEFGSCYMIRNELLEKIKKMNNGKVFDERFKIGMGEDRNLWRQIRTLGLETIKTHNTRVFHQGNVTIAKVENRKQYTFPNRLYLKKLRDAESDGKKITEQEKDKLREDAQKEYENGEL